MEKNSVKNKTKDKERPLRILCWGTFDLSKPRNRILMRSLQKQPVEIITIHKDIWLGTHDKSQLNSLWQKLVIAWRWLTAYPLLIIRYLQAPKHDLVFVGYLGQLDVLILWPFTTLRRVPIVWDMFISLYDTLVRDRRLFASNNPVSRILYIWEWMACRVASIILMDTDAHASMIRTVYNLRPEVTSTVYLGVELDYFPKQEKSPAKADDEPINVLFYGQFIPLHGIEVIISAAEIMRNENIHWKLIGKGQEEEKIRNQIEAYKGELKITWVPWEPYEALIDEIKTADICLGIFGGSEKAANVIPNKVCQILSVGRPLITRDSTAIRELVNETTPGVKLIPPLDPEALAQAIRNLTHEQFPHPHETILDRMNSETIGKDLMKIFSQVSQN